MSDYFEVDGITIQREVGVLKHNSFWDYRCADDTWLEFGIWAIGAKKWDQLAHSCILTDNQLHQIRQFIEAYEAIHG